MAELHEHAPGIRATVYDMGIHAKHIDAVLRLGIVPYVRMPRDSNGVPFGSLGMRNIKTLTDGTHEVEMHYLDGYPGLVTISGGEEWFVRLQYAQIKFRDREAYGRYTVPDHPLVTDQRLRGGSCWFRLTATPKEIEAGICPTAKVRPVPERSPQFQTVFGLSEDTESMHRNYKDCLFAGRARSLGPERQRSDMRGSRSRSNLRAALAYIRRTGETLEGILLPEPVIERTTGPPLAA